MPEVKKAVHSLLLPTLQLSLGLFLIMKTTPLWAVIHCSIAYLLDCCHFRFTDYKQLRTFDGRVFKKVISRTTTAGDVSKVKMQKDPRNLREMNADSENGRRVSVNYLGKIFVLERLGDKMEVRRGLEAKVGENEGTPLKQKGGGKISKHDDVSAYYITDKMWETMKYIEKVAARTVFVKNHKEIWEEVVTGDIMEFGEVLDAVILDNRAVVRLDHDYFLPVNLLLSEEKLRSTLNFVGIFLQTQKQVHWVIPACLSITAAVMGFCTTLRVTVAKLIGEVLCRGVQFLCELLPYKTRRSVYSWGSWVQGFKPSNDFRAKIVRGDVFVVVAGGAKFDSQSEMQRIIPPDCLKHDICSVGDPYLFRCYPNGDSICDSGFIEWSFDNITTKCSLKAGYLALKGSKPSLKPGKTSCVCDDGNGRTKRDINFYTSDNTHSAITVGNDPSNGKGSLLADNIHTASVDIDCSAAEAKKLFIFASYMAELKSGSLKSYERKSGEVYVRHFVESINAYVRSGYPPLHTLWLEDVIVR